VVDRAPGHLRVGTSTLNPTAWQRTAASRRALRTLTTAIAADPAVLDEAVRAALPAFDSLDDLLLQAHAEWARTVDARIDPLLEAGDADARGLRRVWDETARALPGVARLLAHHDRHPAVVRAHAQHVRRVQRLVGAGLPDGWAVRAREHRPARAVRLGCLRLPRLRVA